MFGHGDNVFCFIVADAYGVHMRLAFNFLRKCLEQEVGCGQQLCIVMTRARESGFVH